MTRAKKSKKALYVPYKSKSGKIRCRKNPKRKHYGRKRTRKNLPQAGRMREGARLWRIKKKQMKKEGRTPRKGEYQSHMKEFLSK